MHQKEAYAGGAAIARAVSWLIAEDSLAAACACRSWTRASERLEAWLGVSITAAKEKKPHAATAAGRAAGEDMDGSAGNFHANIFTMGDSMAKSFLCKMLRMP